MLSSVNAFGGLAAAELLKLFGVNSPPSTPGSAPASAAQPAPTDASASSANDPTKAIKAILAEAQIGQAPIGTLGGDGASLLNASVTIASPGALQQIGEAVSELNSLPLATQIGHSSFRETMTAKDAVNVSLGELATMQASGFSSGLPSLSLIEQAYKTLEAQDQYLGIDATFDGNFTLVKLSPNTLGVHGVNITTFATPGEMFANWALVLPQNSINITVSDAQIKG